MLEALEGRDLLSCICFDTSSASLVSWYQAEGDAADSVDDNDGTLHGGIAFTAGPVGQAFQFDGVDDYIDLGKDASLNIPGSFGATMWLNYQAYDNGTGYKYFFGDFQSDDGFTSQGSLGLIGDQLFWHQVSTDGSSIQPTGATHLLPDEWYKVAVVRDDAAKTVKLYVNGVEDASQTYTGTVVDLQGTRRAGDFDAGGISRRLLRGLSR